MSLAYCVKEQKPCVRWVHKYFKDCLCNLKDDFSFSFGIISLVCWGVAEIPQIITNFRTKSSHGISLAFLLTWVAGDVFNLVGCLMEPATVSVDEGEEREPTRITEMIALIQFAIGFLCLWLPTQLYTALLYTASTIVLVLQGLYYDHLYKWLKHRQHVKVSQQVDDDKVPLKPKSRDLGIPIPKPSPRASAPRREFYYTSARSMAGSGTPPFREYLRAARSGPSAMEYSNDSSSDDEAAPAAANSVSQPRPIPRSAGYGTFLAAYVSLPRQTKALTEAYIGFSNRRHLHEAGGMEHSAFGQWLGWLMAAIYMGGRIPQIWLNIKRGSVEGLNPLMFVFALVANVTYVLSIIVRTTEWDSIKANMPWLLDAAVCVVLDLFIILQYIYYRYFRRKTKHEDYYMDANKAGLF